MVVLFLRYAAEVFVPLVLSALVFYSLDPGLAVLAFLQYGTLEMVGTVAAVAIFAGLLFWSWIWGVSGTLLAVPMMVVMKAICDHVGDFQPISDFSSEYPPTPLLQPSADWGKPVPPTGSPN